MKFPTEGLNPFADMILSLYAEKIINASSVGFIPTKWESLEDEEGGDRLFYGPPKRFTEKELLELSGCAVPSNPNAIVVDAYKEREFSGYPAKDIFAEYLKGNMIGLKKDDVLNELHVKNFQIIEKKNFYNGKPAKGFEEFVKEDAEEEPEVNNSSIIPSTVEFTQKFSSTKSYIEYIKNQDESVLNEIRQILDIPVVTELQVSPEQKSGAVLSKKNLSFLSLAVENIQKVLDAAAKEDPDPIKEPEKNTDKPPIKEDNKIIEPPIKAANNIYDEILKEDEPVKVISPNQISQDTNQERALEAIGKTLCDALKGLQSTIKNWK
jgi:hypothetical protein